jgi:hypothetical protein
MANQGSGYGGGGAGGGEKSSDNFTGSSAGRPGIVYIMTITLAGENQADYAGWLHNFGITANPNFLVDVGGTRYMPYQLMKPAYETGATKWAVGKMSLDTGLSTSRAVGTRTYQVGSRWGSDNNTVDKATLAVGGSGEYTFHEFADITGFASDIKLASSKIIHDGVPLRLLYTTDSNGITKYIKSVTTKTVNAGETYSSRIYENQIILVVLQAGGGGGGGADNSWGIFDYAAGGGGGGGGGAGFVVIKSPQYQDTDSSWWYYITQVGSGGSGGSSGDGSRPSGGSGGNTVLKVEYGTQWSGNSGQAVTKEYIAYGGYGGVGADEDDAGGGGPGRGFNVTAGSTTTQYRLTSTVFGTVTGGNGGKVGSGGGPSGSGVFSYTIDDDLIGSKTMQCDTSVGSGGGVGSQNDRGGGGGASWLGNGGYY